MNNEPVCIACERIKRGHVNLDELVKCGNGERACPCCGLVYGAECFALEDQDEASCER